jgi:hypothetical protein
MDAWKVKELNLSHILLDTCNPIELANVEELLLFVSQAELSDYGKYEIVKVDQNATKRYVQICK